MIFGASTPAFAELLAELRVVKLRRVASPLGRGLIMRFLHLFSRSQELQFFSFGLVAPGAVSYDSRDYKKLLLSCEKNWISPTVLSLFCQYISWCAEFF